MLGYKVFNAKSRTLAQTSARSARVRLCQKRPDQPLGRSVRPTPEPHPSQRDYTNPDATTSCSHGSGGSASWVRNTRFHRSLSACNGHLGGHSKLGFEVLTQKTCILAGSHTGSRQASMLWNQKPIPYQRFWKVCDFTLEISVSVLGYVILY